MSPTTSEEKRRRLFFALWPDDATRDQLALSTNNAVSACGGRAVPADNLHITLAFLHSVEESRLPCVMDAAAGLNDSCFDLRLDTIGAFPKAGILWFGPAHIPPSLLALVDHLWTALEPCGFAAEQRRYNPHVTLARKVSKKACQDAIIGPDIGSPRPLDWPISQIALAESHTLQQGARYTVVQRWPLRK